MNDPDCTSTPLLLPAITKTRIKTEYNRVNKHNNRAQKAGLIGDLTIAEWLIILDQHGWTCHFCGADHESMEHMRALHAGGGTTADNVVPACIWCNRKRAAISFGLYSLVDVEEAGLHWLVADFYELYGLMGKIEARLARIKELGKDG